MGTGLHILLFSYVLTLLGMTLVYVYILDILLSMDVLVSILIKTYCIEVAIFFFVCGNSLNFAAQANVPLASPSSWPRSLVALITAPLK